MVLVQILKEFLLRIDTAPLACETPNNKKTLTFILRDIKFRNSGKSMVPFWSASTSLIMSRSSASVGFWPKDLITVPSSLVVMQPRQTKTKKKEEEKNRMKRTKGNIQSEPLLRDEKMQQICDKMKLAASRDRICQRSQVSNQCENGKRDNKQSHLYCTAK